MSLSIEREMCEIWQIFPDNFSGSKGHNAIRVARDQKSWSKIIRLILNRQYHTRRDLTREKYFNRIDKLEGENKEEKKERETLRGDPEREGEILR